MRDLTAKLPKHFPFQDLSPEQKVQLEQKAVIHQYRLGEVLWSVEKPGIQLMILAGKVRLVSKEGTSLVLTSGDWVGDLLDLPGWQARAAGNDVPRSKLVCVLAAWTHP